MPRLSRHVDRLAVLVAGGVAGLSAFVFIVVAQRSLGSAGVAPLTQMWAFWAVCFASISLPLQQATVRAVERGERPRGTALGLLLVPAFGLGAVLVTVWGHESVFRSDDPTWVVLAALVAPLAAMSGVLRGWAAATDNRAHLTAYLAGENGIRAATALIMALLDLPPPAFGVALLAGYLVYLPGLRSAVTALGGTRSEPTTEHALAGSVAFGLGSYSILVVAPALLALGPTADAELGQLFILLALSRAPYQIAQAFVPRLAVEVERGAEARVSGPVVVGALLTACATAAVVGPPALAVVTGESTGPSPVVFALATAMSGLAIMNLALAVVATGRYEGAGQRAVWITGTVVAVMAVVAGDTPVSALMGITAAEMIVLGLQLAAHRARKPMEELTSRSDRRPASVPSPPPDR